MPVDIRSLLLHEAGYKCGNPICRFPLTLEIHHLVPVAMGGSDDPNNLICLCPNCHTSHHSGTIPEASLRTWKHVLLSLNNAYDRKSVDLLLAIHKVKGLPVTGDGLLHCAALVASGLLEIAGRTHGRVTGSGPDIFDLCLSQKGIRFVEAWINGKEHEAYAPEP